MRNYLLNLIKDSANFIFSSIESTDGPQCKLLIEICKISALGIPNQSLIRSKKLGVTLYDTFERFWKFNEYNDIGF